MRGFTATSWLTGIILTTLLVNLACSKRTIDPPPTQEEFVAALHQQDPNFAQVYATGLLWDTSFADISMYYPDTGEVVLLPLGFRYDVEDSGRTLNVEIKKRASFVGNVVADSGATLDQRRYVGNFVLHARPLTGNPRDFSKPVELVWRGKSISWIPEEQRTGPFDGWEPFYYSLMGADFTGATVPVVVSSITFSVNNSTHYTVSPNPLSNFFLKDAPCTLPGNSVTITVHTASDDLLAFLHVGEPDHAVRSPMQLIGSGDYQGVFQIPGDSPVNVWRHVGVELIHRSSVEEFASDIVSLELLSIVFTVFGTACR